MMKQAAFPLFLSLLATFVSAAQLRATTPPRQGLVLLDDPSAVITDGPPSGARACPTLDGHTPVVTISLTPQILTLLGSGNECAATGCIASTNITTPVKVSKPTQVTDTPFDVVTSSARQYYLEIDLKNPSNTVDVNHMHVDFQRSTNDKFDSAHAVLQGPTSPLSKPLVSLYSCRKALTYPNSDDTEEVATFLVTPKQDITQYFNIVLVLSEVVPSSLFSQVTSFSMPIVLDPQTHGN